MGKTGRRYLTQDSLVTSLQVGQTAAADINSLKSWEVAATRTRSAHNESKLRKKYIGIHFFDNDDDVQELRRVVDVEWSRHAKEYVLVTELIGDDGVASDHSGVTLEPYVINTAFHEMIAASCQRFNSTDIIKSHAKRARRR